MNLLAHYNALCSHVVCSCNVLIHLVLLKTIIRSYKENITFVICCLIVVVVVALCGDFISR